MGVEKCSKCGVLVRIYGRSEWHTCKPKKSWFRRLFGIED